MLTMAVIVLLALIVPAVLLYRFKSSEHVYNEIHEIAGSRFYDPTKMPEWNKWKKTSFDKVETRDQTLTLANQMLASLDDPYTVAMGPKLRSDQVRYESGEFVGLGIRIAAAYENKTGEDCELESAKTGVSCSHPTIVGVVGYSPAGMARIKAGDILISVDGESTLNKPLVLVQQSLRGRIATEVALGISSNGTERTVLLIRSFVSRPTILAKMLAGNVGYLRIEHFRSWAEDEAVKRSEKLSEARAIIVDLRDNPGGDYYAGVRTAGLFIENGIVALTQSRLPGPPDRPEFVTSSIRIVDRKLQEVFSSAGKKTSAPGRRFAPPGVPVAKPIFAGKRVIVLVNGGTASAAETFASALRDTAGARIVGTRSYGKGIGQQMFNLPWRVVLKITTFKTFSPNGYWVGDGGQNRHGLVPDVELTAQETLYDIGSKQDEHLLAALALLC